MWLSIIDFLKKKRQRIIWFWKSSLRCYWVTQHKHTNKFGLQTCVRAWIRTHASKNFTCTSTFKRFSWTTMSWFHLSLFQFNKITVVEQVSFSCGFQTDTFSYLTFYAFMLSHCLIAKRRAVQHPTTLINKCTS